MRLLRSAVKKQRWDLAAHTIVLVTARHLSKSGERNNGEGNCEKKGRAKR